MQSYSGHQFRNSLFAVLLLSSCGSATFKESSGSPPKGGAGDIEKPTPPDKITSLTWYWQCNTSPG
ncbi:MAG: hypothetical protein NTV34_04895, partial [Proteobacteria bacterium]|nr:hypothetical protein [Pseudomonadota bacterium]